MPHLSISLNGTFAHWLAEAKVAARGADVDRHTTEDLVHDTLLRTMQHPPRGARPGAWIQRICRNLRVDGWRAQARSQRLGEQLPAPSSAATGEEATLAHERRRAVRRAVMTLPREQRRALILRYHGGWSFDRIAARLGMPEPTARTRVHRALATLRAQMAALRVMIAPGALALKPALAVLIVLAINPAPPPQPQQQPAAGATVARSGLASIRAARGSRPHTADRAWLAQSSSAAVSNARAAHSPHPQARSDAPLAVRRFDFEDDEVPGELQRPNEEAPIAIIERARQPSLIELRREFLPEIAKSLEGL